jgi:uncharacterized protein YqeY
MAEPLRARLESDMKAAMKSGDVFTRDTVRFVLAALKNAEIDKRDALSEEEGIALLHRQVKRMAESLEQYQSANRTDLADREAAQIEIVKRYLPAELSDDELNELARNVVAETGATSAKDLGRVMPILIERAAGRADGKRLSGAARAALTAAG